MELFKTIKINLAKCLFLPNQKHLFNTKRLLSILAAFSIVVIVVLFFIFEANSAIEYVRSAYMSITAIGLLINFLSLVFKTNEIFLLIDTNFTETINKSELFQILFLLSLLKIIDLILFRIEMSSIKFNVH